MNTGMLFRLHQGDEGWVLKKFNLKIEKGKTIALVGQSGSVRPRLPICCRAFMTLSMEKFYWTGRISGLR